MEMMSEKMDLEKMLPLIRKEIETSEIAKKISELDSKLVEVKKVLEGIVIELTYIKSELRDLGENRERRPIQTYLREREAEKQLKTEGVKIDVIKREKSDLERKVEKAADTQKGDDKDLIICD